MMRKTSIVLLSAAAGAALTLLVTQPRVTLIGSSARAAASDGEHSSISPLTSCRSSQ